MVPDPEIVDESSCDSCRKGGTTSRGRGMGSLDVAAA